MPSPLFDRWTLSADVLHLNHGSFGAAPRAVQREQQRWRDLLEENPDAFMHTHYQPALDAARGAVATFVGAEPGLIGLVNNATSGINAVLRSLEATLKGGDEIVITNQTYNACRNAAVVTAKRTGATVVTAEIPFPISDPSDVLAAFIKCVSDRTRLVITDAITSPTALILPVADLVAALEPDVPILVDAAHAPGMIEYDLDAIGASYTTGNCHKWMCAPKGAAFLHVRADRAEDIYPAVISHGYNGGWPTEGGHVHRQFDWAGTADPSAWFSIPSAIETVGSFHADGWRGVREVNRAVCLEGRSIVLEALGTDSPAPESMIGSIAAVPLRDLSYGNHEIFDPLTTALRERWAIESPVFVWGPERNRTLRLSAHLYNDRSDYERLAEALVAELARP